MWKITNKQLHKKFAFETFVQAMEFVSRVAELAEREQHHPLITINYNVVELALSTHSQGGLVTEKDHNLAKAIDDLLKPIAADIGPKPLSYKELKLYADGGSRGNPGPSASGYVLMAMDDNVVKKSGIYIGITTNNQAEYLALKLGLEEALKLQAQTVHIYLDSLLVVNQMKGLFKVRNRDLWPIHTAIKELTLKFKHINFTHIPRELNKLADAEVNIVLDAERQK